MKTPSFPSTNEQTPREHYSHLDSIFQKYII